jgi:regulatory protein YycH of two-component signal transduction system YycFG
MNRKEIMKLIEMDKVKIIESEKAGDQKLHPLKERYGLFIEKIENLIEEGKQKQYIPDSIPTGGTAKLIAQSIGVNAMNEDLSVDSIVRFILNGMSVRDDLTD